MKAASLPRVALGMMAASIMLYWVAWVTGAWFLRFPELLLALGAIVNMTVWAAMNAGCLRKVLGESRDLHRATRRARILRQERDDLQRRVDHLERELEQEWKRRDCLAPFGIRADGTQVFAGLDGRLHYASPAQARQYMHAAGTCRDTRVKITYGDPVPGGRRIAAITIEDAPWGKSDLSSLFRLLNSIPQLSDLEGEDDA